MLGPVLFIIYINDIVDNTGTDVTVNLFAGDVKLYSRVDSLNCHILQSTIDAIVDWADKWQLRINIYIFVYCRHKGP